MLIAHIVHRLSIGGLENGLINLVNEMDRDNFQHTIISLTDITSLRERIKNNRVNLIEIGKKEGIDSRAYAKLYRVLRRIRPDVVHTRNLGTIDCQLIAFVSGVPIRIHGEHGRGMRNLDGDNPRDIQIRKFMKPFIHKYVALSKDIESWLVNSIGVPRDRIIQIYNGVDTEKFKPRQKNAKRNDIKKIITIGRLQSEKDQMTLIHAFSILLARPKNAQKIRLVIVGDGPDRIRIEEHIENMGLADQIDVLGERDDIDRRLQECDIFALSSLTEGISNTILEAMSCGLPVVATDVGGNPELVIHGETGFLVPRKDPEAMAEAIQFYLDEPRLITEHGSKGRQRVVENFSLVNMVKGYESMYRDLSR